MSEVGSKRICVGLIGVASLAAALASVPAGDAEAAPGFTVRAVATGGEAAPEFLPGFELAPNRADVAGIDAAGRVVFRTAVVDASGAFHADAVYQETNQGLRAVLVTDEPAPSVGVGGSPGTIAGITGMKTGPGGDSLFFCDLGAAGGALVADVDSQLHVVAAEVSTVPGVCGLSDIMPAAFTRSTAFQGGRAVFRAETGPDPCVPAERQGMYRRVGLGGVEKLLQFGDTIRVSHDPGVDKPLEEGFALPSIDQDGNAVFIVSYLDSAGEPAVVYAPASGAPQVIVAEDDPVPGRPGNVWESFSDVLIDAGSLTQDSVPRIAYVGLEKATLATFVMEWNEGITSEVMRTSTTRRGVDFEGGFSTRLLSASRRRLIVIGDASGDDVAGFEDGVWRHDPLQTGDAQIELIAYSGEAAPGAPGFTFHWLQSVFCNSEGRVAIIATIRNGSTFETAVFMEDGGQLKLAVREGDTIPDGRGGSVTLGEISAPGDWGSGGAGRGVRFNARGELVFSAITDRSPNFGGVFVVTSGSAPPSGPGTAEVRVRKSRNGMLRMSGSRSDDRVSIRQTAPGEITLVAGDGTTINGNAGPLVMTGVTGLLVNLGDGDDELVLGGERNTTVETVLPRNVIIRTGAGADDVTVRNVSVSSLRVDLGTGRTGTCTASHTQVGGALTVSAGGGGLVSVLLDDVSVERRTRLNFVRAGGCLFSAPDSLFRAPVNYAGSRAGDDSILWERTEAQRPVAINTGRGDHDEIRLVSATLQRTALVSNAAATDVESNLTTIPRVTIRGASEWNVAVNQPQGAGNYRVATRGRGTCTYACDGGTYGAFTLTQRGGDCEWDVDGCTFERLDLRLRGPGTTDCSIADVQTDRLRLTTGAGDDTCTLTDTQAFVDIVGRLGAGDDVLRLTRTGTTIMLILFGAGDDCGELDAAFANLLRGRGGRGQDKISGTATLGDQDYSAIEDSDGVVVLAKR